MKKYLIIGFVVAMLFISGCAVSKTGEARKPPQKIKGYCGDQLVDHGEQCDFYGDGTPMLLGHYCAEFKNYNGGVLDCYRAGQQRECKLNFEGCYT